MYFLDKTRNYQAIRSGKIYLRPIDIAALSTLGYEFNCGILFCASYKLGLTDIEPNAGVSQKSKGWGLSVGYLMR